MRHYLFLNSNRSTIFERNSRFHNPVNCRFDKEYASGNIELFNKVR
jgi:hypothetical protein